MSIVEIHRSALEEVIVPYHDFLLKYSVSKNRLFGFVEGKDDPSYYQGHICPHISGKGWELILIESGRPGNRDRVLRLLNLIDWEHYSRKQIAFFIDRDLSDLLGGSISTGVPENLYITDSYSIENDIVSDFTLIRTLKEMYNVNLLDPELEVILKLFNQGLSKIAWVVTIITNYYLQLYTAGQKPKFQDLEISEVISIDQCKVISKSKEEITEYLSRRWPCELQIQKEFLENCLSDCSSPYKYVRGKYLMWYFVGFINSFCNYCNTIIPSLNKPITGYRRLCEKFAVQDLAPRSAMPSSLMEFIRSTYLAYINKPQSENGSDSLQAIG